MAHKRMFKNLKLQEQFILYMKHVYKAVIVDTRSSRTAMKGKTSDGKDIYFFLGKSGAVRINFKNAVTDSRSKTEYYQAKLQEPLMQFELEMLWNTGTLNLD